MLNHATFMQALADAQGQPESTLDALFELVDEHIGVRLMTLMTFDSVSRHACRIYSNMPDAYPVSGTKPMNTTAWAAQVIGDHQSFVANTVPELAEVFDDYQLIASLKCGSIINIPIVVGGRLLGTVNCLHQEHYYTPDKVAASEALKLSAVACFMLLESIKNKREQV